MQEWKRRKSAAKTFQNEDLWYFRSTRQTRRKWYSSLCYFITLSTILSLLICILSYFCVPDECVQKFFHLGNGLVPLSMYLGYGFDSLVSQGLASLCFPWRAQTKPLQSLLSLKIEASLLEVFFFLEYFCSLSNDSKSFNSEGNSEKGTWLCLYQICILSAILCEVQVNWEPSPWVLVVDHWLCNILIMENYMLEGRRKTWKEGILTSQQDEAKSI